MFSFSKNHPHALKAFTLIELLVVIAIISLLSSVVLTSLNGARAKGRDARRLSDLKEIANAFNIAQSVQPVTTAGCTAYGAAASTCTVPDLSKFSDPTSATTCTKTSAAPCNYMIGKQDGSTGNPTTENYEICAYLETGSGSLPAGLVYVASNTGGSPKTGCN